VEFKEPKNLLKVGGSLVVVIPTMWVKAQELKEGDSVIVEVTDDAVIITKPKGR